MARISGFFEILAGQLHRETPREKARRIVQGLFGHDILTMDENSGGYIRSTQQPDAIPYKEKNEGQALFDAGIHSGSYYAVYEGYTEPGDPTYVPLKIDIGFVGKGGYPIEMLSIYLNHEKPDEVEINFCGPWPLGLDSAKGSWQTMMLLKTAGRMMKRIEAGKEIDPHHMRQHLIEKAGIKPDAWTVRDRILENYPGGITAHPELRNAERLKRLKVTRRRNHSPK